MAATLAHTPRMLLLCLKLAIAGYASTLSQIVLSVHNCFPTRCDSCLLPLQVTEQLTTIITRFLVLVILVVCMWM